MKLYNFAELIEKYSVDCEIRISGKGQWAAGEWKEPEPAIQPYRCAIVPMTEQSINNSGGNYKTGDCNIITVTPLNTDTDVFIIYKDKIYKVSQETDYSDYSDVYSYAGRRVSSFDKS